MANRVQLKEHLYIVQAGSNWSTTVTVKDLLGDVKNQMKSESLFGLFA